MRIGIIGAGFYGISIATALSVNHEVDLYESAPEPMLGASIYNQHRLHLGFHYPRCDKTIIQAKSCFERFLNDYDDCTFEIPANYYLNHKKSFVTGDQFSSKMESHNLDFETTLIPSKIVSPKDYDFSCVVPERGINTERFRQKTISNLASSKVNLILNTKVKCAEIRHQYDFVINCTYTDPHDSYDIDTKAELAILLVCKSDESWHNKAITIMDGPFCSIYPGNPGHHTISSVVFTPAIKANHPEILKKISTQLSDDEWEKIENDIWNHASSFVNLTGLQKVGRYQIIKTKTSK